jgi:hypothetical protein
MKNDEGRNPSELWRSQSDEPTQNFAREEVRAKARKYEREGVIIYRAFCVVIPIFIAAFLYGMYNMMRLGKPWLVIGSGFGLVWAGCIAWGLVRNGRRRIPAQEPCERYLQKLFERKCQGLLWLRKCTLLLIPMVLASWWGAGPEIRAKTWGFQSRWLISALHGPAPLLVMGVVIAFLWWAFSREARRFEREIQQLAKQST